MNAAKIANDISASAICTLTHSGYTGWQISSWRPSSNSYRIYFKQKNTHTIKSSLGC